LKKDFVASRLLHASDYYLNLEMHYRSRFKANLEVKRGLLKCLTRMVKDEDEETLWCSSWWFQKWAKYFDCPL